MSPFQPFSTLMHSLEVLRPLLSLFILILSLTFNKLFFQRRRIPSDPDFRRERGPEVPAHDVEKVQLHVRRPRRQPHGCLLRSGELPVQSRTIMNYQ